MISVTDLKQSADAVLRRAVVTIPPKRRSKFIAEAAADEDLQLPPSGVSRHRRMRRSGQMSVHWRNHCQDQLQNSVRISPEILSALNRAIGALGKSPAKQPIDASA